MGGKCPSRKVKKRRFSHKTARRSKFLLKDILTLFVIITILSINQSIHFVSSTSFFLFFVSLTVILLPRDDAVYDELQKSETEKQALPVDEDLPGMGQYYCLHCDRYFANTSVRDEHFKTKRHKKRVKLMMGPAPHTQLDADLAGGMGAPDNGPKLMSI